MTSPTSRRARARDKSLSAASTAALARAGRRLELQDAHKRACRTERQILPRAGASCGHHIAPDLGALDAEFGEPRVEYGLLHRHRGAHVGHRRGMIELVDREVRGGEASLRQQGAEYEDRLIAALDAFGDVDTRKEAGARLPDALGCLVVGGRQRTRRGGRRPRALHGFAEREWRLRKRVRSGQDVGRQKDDDRPLRLTAVHLWSLPLESLSVPLSGERHDASDWFHHGTRWG